MACPAYSEHPTVKIDLSGIDWVEMAKAVDRMYAAYRKSYKVWAEDVIKKIAEGASKDGTDG